MYKRILVMAMLVVVSALLAACNGNSGIIDPPPGDFDRMTAVVQDADGAPLAGLAVRVEGQATGQTTNNNGEVVLTAGAFPRGVNAPNELSFGRNGLIIGTETVTPISVPNPVIRFGGGPDTGTGSVSGTVFDEIAGTPLLDVELNLFSPDGGVHVTISTNGSFSFPQVAAGTWQLAANKDGYHPEMAQIIVRNGEESIKHLAMSPEDVIVPGDGVIVKGFLRDFDTGEPVGGALISLMADTGYIGIPEPWLVEEMQDWEDDNIGWAESGGGFGGIPEDPVREPSMVAPWHYDTQFQETTTNADGSFEFPEEVVGYSAWLDMNADGYLPGSHYEDIYERQGVINLELTLDAYVQTDISGVIIDELGSPVEGAYVEFIFAGDWGGPSPMLDVAMPGVMPPDEMFIDGMEVWEDFDVPPPPMAPDANGDERGGWEDAALEMTNGQSAPEPLPGMDSGTQNDVDNPWMMRFRFENREGERTSSDLEFTGYYSAITEADGTFVFEDVPAGDYWVFADAYRHIAYNDMEAVEEDSTQNDFIYVLENVPVGSVEGYVTDEHGNAIHDALVNATQPNVDPFSYTDETGYYRIDNIPVGQWLISAYIQGFLTVSFETPILEDGVAKINLVLPEYTPPTQTLIDYSGHLEDGASGSGVTGADMVFTPVDPTLGGYYQHVFTGDGGTFSARLIPTEYNLLIQKEGYEDVFTRIWVDSEWPSMDFWLWPIGSGGGPWGGWGPMPMEPGMEFNDAVQAPNAPDPVLGGGEAWESGGMPPRGDEF